MASGPITSWEINGETVETVSDFIFYLFLFIFNFYFYFVLLYNTVLVLPYIDMNLTRVYMTLFCGAPKSLQMMTAAMKLKDAWWLRG